MKTKQSLFLSLLCASFLISSCSESQELESINEQTVAVQTMNESASVLPQNPLYVLTGEDDGVYTAELKDAVLPASRALSTELKVSVEMPEDVVMTGISFRVGDKIYFAEFQTPEDQNFLHLHSGDQLNFNLLVDSDFAAKEILVRVHAAGQITIEKLVKVEFSADHQFELTAEDFQVKASNNWMASLPDDMYVSQLSLPGTHDAATGDGTSLSIGKTQDLTLQQQWNQGIRVFDLRPGYKKVRKGWFKYENVLHIYHGIIETNTSFAQAMNCLINNLKQHPEEFAMVLMQFEKGINTDRNVWNSLMSKFLSNPEIKKYCVEYRADLKLSDVRGKLLILSRDAYANQPIVGAFVSGWSFSTEGTTNGVLTGKGGFKGQLNVQDYYDVKDPSAKVNAVKKYVDAAAANTSANTLTINHTSGYTGTAVNKGYYVNAANVNPEVYKYIIDQQRAKGSVGIIMMDHVGKNSVKYMGTKYAVYGQLLPQAIIDNNFRKASLK